jgi:alpha-beta hydrolase superfamily lysophospholipase
MDEGEILPLTATDGTPLKVRRTVPPDGSRPKGIVVYLHGIQSHLGWYGDSSSHLARAGLAVYFPDRRGCGLNAADRGDCRSWEQLAADVTMVEDTAIAEWDRDGERPPLVLLAVSWGGKLAAALAAMHGSRYAGLAMLCPGIFPKRDVTFRTKCRIALALARGGNRRFPIPLDDPRLFTATPRWLDFLNDDPLTLHDATARFLFESRRLDGAVAGGAPWIHVPTYLALAGNDAIIDNERTIGYLDRIAATDKTLHVYDEAHHTLEFEPDPTSVFDDLAEWIVARCAARAATGQRQGVDSR